MTILFRDLLTFSGTFLTLGKAGLGQTSSVACILLCPKPINKFKMVQRSRHQMLRAYSPNIHTVIQAIFNDSLPFLDLKVR